MKISKTCAEAIEIVREIRKAYLAAKEQPLHFVGIDPSDMDYGIGWRYDGCYPGICCPTVLDAGIAFNRECNNWMLDTTFTRGFFLVERFGGRQTRFAAHNAVARATTEFLRNKGAKVWEITPAQWRYLVFGLTSVAGADSKRWCQKIYDLTDHNAAEAACMAEICYRAATDCVMPFIFRGKGV